MSLSSWHRLARRLSGWLLAALVLATLAPAVSRSLVEAPPQDVRDWVELCTSQGMQRVHASDVALDLGAEPDGNRSSGLDLCGHCALAAEWFAPLLPTWPVVAAVAVGWTTPAFLSVGLLSAQAPPAAARGPPIPG